MEAMFRGASAFSHILCWKPLGDPGSSMGSNTDTNWMFENSGGGDMDQNCDMCGTGTFRGPSEAGERACEACPKGTSNTAPATYEVEDTQDSEMGG